MQIAVFENSTKVSLAFVVEPRGDAHEVPPHGSVGIRYRPKEGAPERSYSIVSEGRIEFWCDADGYEVEVVHPSAFDLLSWDICVDGGWCGGIVDGKPTQVTDLLPQEGLVSARAFAEYALLADGCSLADAKWEKHLVWIEQRFVERMGAQVVAAGELRMNLRRPFEPPTG